MKLHEQNIREILDHTQHQLRKLNNQFRFKVVYNAPRKRYEVQVLMGRQEFEEVYCFGINQLNVFGYGKYFHDDWYNQIKKNLELNKIFNQ